MHILRNRDPHSPSLFCAVYITTNICRDYAVLSGINIQKCQRSLLPHVRVKRRHMFFKTYVNFYQHTRRHILAACNLYSSRSKNFVARIVIDIVPLEGFLICSNVAEQKFRVTISDRMSEIIKFRGLGL